MKLQDIQIDNTVRSGLNSFTGGVIIRDTKVLISKRRLSTVWQILKFLRG